VRTGAGLAAPSRETTKFTSAAETGTVAQIHRQCRPGNRPSGNTRINVTNPRKIHGQAPAATASTAAADGQRAAARDVEPQSSSANTSAGIVAVSANAGPTGLAGTRATTSQLSARAGNSRTVDTGQSAGDPTDGGPYASTARTAAAATNTTVAATTRRRGRSTTT